jgi:hypothetical protein
MPLTYQSSASLHETIPAFIVSTPRRCCASFHNQFQSEINRLDGGPSVFVDELHTEIPALRKWCKDLTIKSRKHTSKLFYEYILTFVKSVLSHIEGLERVTYQVEHTELSEQWQTPPSQAFGHDKNDIEAIQASDRGENMFRSSMGDNDSKRNLVGIYPRLCNEFSILEDGFVQDLKRRMRGRLNRACDKGATRVCILAPSHWH